MRSIRNILAVLALAVLLCTMLPASVFAAGSVKMTVDSTLFVVQGSTSYVNVEAEPETDAGYRLQLISPDKDITTDGATGVLNGKSKATLSFTADERAKTGYYTLTLQAVDASGGSVLSSQYVFVDIVENIDSFSSLGTAAIEVGCTIQGADHLTAGEVNFVKFSLFNRGNSSMKNARVTIDMPSGMTIQSGPATRNIGTFAIGGTASVDYPLLLDAGMTSGSYPISVTVTGVKGDETKTATEAIYIPVSGKAASDETKPLLIVDSFDYGSGQIAKGANFTLKMKLLNTGSRDIHNVIVNVLEPSGLVVPAGSSYIKIDSIAAGEAADASIALRSVKDASGTQANLTVDMRYMDPDNDQIESSYPILVALKGDSSGSGGGVSNPILMVTDYSFGGTNVLAGSDFPLNLTITNTSGKTLRNIKVTVQESGANILPSEGSNSFFVNSIASGASVGHLMPMTVRGSTMPQICALSVSMSYEDMDGGTFSSSDSITIPVTQEDRLVVDDVLDPGYLMAGEQGYVSIRYYNMGKTTLNNLRVSVEGDFTVDGDASNYVGNMQPGRSDYFSFNFFPNEEGEMKGKATFTYENEEGEEKSLEKEFTFNIQPAPVWEDPGMDMPVEPVKQGLPLWGKGLIGLGALIALIVAVKLVKKHKKAKAEALELDE
ncbi:MAG: hypothetical protein K5981_08320 [Clostridia bacterium]|nr:hypothetical protein [Clostridia bacterium]